MTKGFEMHFLDLRTYTCYKDVQNLDDIEGSSPGTSCKEPLTPTRLTRTQCCCSLGSAYGDPDMCKACPARGTSKSTFVYRIFVYQETPMLSHFL